MATPDEQWWEAQAGEYALGTLRGSEREVFEKILAADSDTRARVQWWQNQLKALDSRIAPVEPPAHLLPLIMKRIGAQKHWSETVQETTEQPVQETTTTQRTARETVRTTAPETAVPAQPDRTDNVVSYRRSQTRRSNVFWKSIAGLATAASISLAAILLQITLQDDIQRPDAALNMVSIVQNDSQESLWILSTQTDSDLLQVVTLTSLPLEADRSFELWMVKPDDGGVSSVGLLPATEGESRLLTLPLDTAEAQLFAVSLEPKGGSPETVPTGPVMFTGSIRTISQTLL